MATRPVPLARQAREAADCTRCDLYERATQTVYGAGAPDASIVLVGEQPGDREDIEGEPFVGPAGRLLATALEAAGIDPGAVYLTNAVKHFKWEERGKRRIHKKPSAVEIQACHTWLEQELDAIRPRVVVSLGTTAGRAVLGRPVVIGAVRGTVVDGPGGLPVVVTIHPSAVLRARGDRTPLLDGLTADLRFAADVAEADE